LLHRRWHGEGQFVENPQLNATMAHLAHIVRRNGEAIGAGLLDPLQFGIGPFERLYQTNDGWIMIEARSDSERRALSVDVQGDDDTIA
jgi:crotonobetainyl-CoA:carnitine CoA-transferase CaiB-like acyl-CoA transferase